MAKRSQPSSDFSDIFDSGKRRRPAPLADLFENGDTIHELSGQNPLKPSTFEQSIEIAAWQVIRIEDATRKPLELLATGGATGAAVYVMTPSRSYEEVLQKLEYLKLTRSIGRFVVKIVALSFNANARRDAYNDAVIGYHLNRLRFGTDLVPTPITPCFAQTIDWFHSAIGGKYGTQYTIVERAEYEFKRYMKKRPTPRQLLAHIAMVLHALEAAWEWFDYVHYDLHEGNVMMRKAYPKPVRKRDWTFERAHNRRDYDRKRGTLRFAPEDHSGLLPTIIDLGMGRLQAPYGGAERRGYTFEKTPGAKFTRIVHNGSPFSQGYGRVSGDPGSNKPPNRGWDVRRWGMNLLARISAYVSEHDEAREDSDGYVLADELARIAVTMSGLDVWIERLASGEVTKLPPYMHQDDMMAMWNRIKAAIREGRYFAVAMEFDESSPYGSSMVNEIKRKWCWSFDVYVGDTSELIYGRTPSDILDDGLFATLFGDADDAESEDEFTDDFTDESKGEPMAVWRNPVTANEARTKLFTPVEEKIGSDTGVQITAGDKARFSFAFERELRRKIDAWWHRLDVANKDRVGPTSFEFDSDVPGGTPAEKARADWDGINVKLTWFERSRDDLSRALPWGGPIDASALDAVSAGVGLANIGMGDWVKRHGVTTRLLHYLQAKALSSRFVRFVCVENVQSWTMHAVMRDFPEFRLLPEWGNRPHVDDTVLTPHTSYYWPTAVPSPLAFEDVGAQAEDDWAPCQGVMCHRRAVETCGACRKAAYCSVECQTDDWLVHRDECAAET